MSDGRSDSTEQPQAGPGRWARASRWIRAEGRFVADTVHPESAGLSRGRRLATWSVVLVCAIVGVGVGTAVGMAINFLTAGTEAGIDDHAQGDLDAEKGYIHASFRSKPYDSYDPPFSVSSRTKLTPRQVEGIGSGEYDSSVLKDAVAGAEFGLGGDDRRPGSGQVYFVDLVSDSSSMVTVTDIDAVNIRCRRSDMVTEIYTASEGAIPIVGLAFKLQDHRGTLNGFVTDNEDPNYGRQYFDHATITLGGGADNQTLTVLGVADPGSRCTWDLESRFTTDDGEEHRKKLNNRPLVTEGGPDEGPGTQHLRVTVDKLIQWACTHGQRRPDDCVGVPPA
ncbi:hypothetical protein [Streptomyces sp. NPDC060184]|uniref:hypothetical protein n=1 Tax=Streptomyces sp. NPDC060184 TaxID=3347064 RepID=UPI003651F760